MKQILVCFFLLVLAIPSRVSACNPPSGLGATLSGTSAVLSWVAQPGATSYEIEVEDANNNPVSYHVEQKVSGLSFTVTGLLEGKGYKFKVRSYCQDDHGDWSEWFFFGGSVSSPELVVKSGLIISPNPVKNGSFMLELSNFQPQTFQIRIMDALGMVIFSQTIGTMGDRQSQLIELPDNLQTGMYYLLLSGAQIQMSQKLFVGKD